MATLKRLINGQNITFDTHQAGDGQAVNWRAVHLEKRMHGRAGKIRFPLFGNERGWNAVGMSPEYVERVVAEVTRALQNDKQLAEELAKVVAKTIARFSSGKATTADAKTAARTLAEIFDLDEDFVTYSERFANKNLVSASTIHVSRETGNVHELYQDGKKVRITKVRDHVML